MTIRDYLRIVRDQRLIATIGIVLGLALAATYYFVRPPEYTANLTMYVSSQGADTTQAAFQGAQLSQDRVASYTELLTGPRVTSNVIAKLALAETPEGLAKKMTASSKLDSVLLDVAVTDPSPQRATDIVNAVGEVFPDLVSELERPTTPGASPAVAVRVVQPAILPTTPSSAGLPLTLSLGLLAGIIVGIASALIRNSLDTSVKSPDQLREIAGAPNLGVVAYDPQVPRIPLTVHEDPQSPRSEAFRQLRTNLQFVDVDHPKKVLVVTSSMPAEGKTTTLVNLAIATAAAGSRVLIVDADLRRPKVGDLLGLDSTAGLTSVLAGRALAEGVIQQWASGAFDVLASGPLPPNPSELLGSQQMKAILSELRRSYDVILIDTPPLLPVTDAAAIAPAADGVVLVCRYKRTTRNQVELAVQALRAVSAPLLSTVFNMVPSTGARAYAQYNSYYRAEPQIRSEATPAIGRSSVRPHATPRPFQHVPIRPGPPIRNPNI